MSKINGDKKRDNLRARRQTKMREKMREIRATMNAAAKPAPTKPAAKGVATKASPAPAATTKAPA